MIVVNCKTYLEGSGERARRLVQIAMSVSRKTGARVVVAVQVVDLRLCAGEGECWVQHVDAEGRGRHTGAVTVEAVMEVGAKGSLLNHSEHKTNLAKYNWQKLQALGFETCVCVEGVEEWEAVREVCRPNWVAYEPPELIGSRDKSVASVRPETIELMVRAAGEIPVLVGAGVHAREDVKAALELGAKGVLVATDVVLVEDPEKELRELAEGFNF